MPVLLSLLMAAATSVATELSPAEQFTREAEQWVLQGKALPPDYRLRLLQMEPADRIQAIIFLRRAGLLEGSAWTVQDMLRRDAGASGEAH